MFRLATLVLVIIPSISTAQLTPPGSPRLPLTAFPQIGGGTVEQLRRSEIALLAGQVLNEITAAKGELARSQVPGRFKIPLLTLVDQSLAACEQVRALAARNAPPAQLRAADDAHDRAFQAMAAEMTRVGIYSPPMVQALARAQNADQQLHAALHRHDGRPPQGQMERLRRLGTMLDDQADTLRDLSRDAAEAMPALGNLERTTRSFRFRAQAFDRAADGVVAPAQLAGEFAELLRAWRGVGATLAMNVPSNIRLQATRVDNTLHLMADLLPAPPGGWDWTVPGPNPGGGIGFLGRGALAVGAGDGGGPRVRLFANRSGDSTYDFFAYDPAFRGGVRVAVADLTGDGIPDLVTAPGPGAPALIRVFDGRTLRLLTEFTAFEANWLGGAFVAATDRCADGRAWIAVSADAGGGPRVKVFDLAAGRELDDFFPFDQNFRGGARVALGDVNGDGVPDLVATPGPTGEPRVRIFDGRNRAILADFLAFDRNDTTGLSVAVADLTKNGRADLIVGTGAGSLATVRIFDATNGKRIGELLPFPRGFRGGVHVAGYDLDRNGTPDVVCAPGSDPNHVALPIKVFSGVNAKPLGEFFPFEPTFRGGAYIGSR